jgi:hypothetical protein
MIHYIGNNNVGDEGLKVLLKKTWINIERLDLCNKLITQARTKLVQKDWNACRRLSQIA